MEAVRTFLESSTIHGLTYISTTKKYARLFWIFVVAVGFSGAVILIKESFQSWSESPVKTTVETLPISMLKLPKVTVCPPKNTFTDLNYDIMHAENRTLTKEERDIMFNFALNLIESPNKMKQLHLMEEGRFFNLYHGYTKTKISSNSYNGFNFVIYTSASSGIVTTRHYGEEFNPEKVIKLCWLQVLVFVPEGQINNENVTLHFEVKQVAMTKLSNDNYDGVNIDGLMMLEDYQTNVYTNFTPPCGDCPTPYYYRHIKLERSISSEDLETAKLQVMPGFQVRWWFTGDDILPDRKYKDHVMTKHFVRFVYFQRENMNEGYTYLLFCRFVNLVSSNNVDEKVIWGHIWTIRSNYVKKDKDNICLDGNFISEKEVGRNFNELVKLLKVFNISERVDEQLSKNKIEIGGKMFVTLNSCPSVLTKLYMKILYGPQSSIVTRALNILKNTGREFRPTAIKILSKIISSLGYEYIYSYKNETSENSDTNEIFQKDIFMIRGILNLVGVDNFLFYFKIKCFFKL